MNKVSVSHSVVLLEYGKGTRIAGTPIDDYKEQLKAIAKNLGARMMRNCVFSNLEIEFNDLNHKWVITEVD